tara:strand:+ start:398 stop:517 length:120 start_codon:yes stop_codon:yes gene_type:complete
MSFTYCPTSFPKLEIPNSENGIILTKKDILLLGSRLPSL